MYHTWVMLVLLAGTQLASAATDCCADVAALKADVNHLKKVTSCPVGYTYVNEMNGCYLLNMIEMSWESAQQTCQSVGAHLAHLKTQKQTDLVNLFLRSRGVTSDTCSDGVWIGGQRQNPNSCNTPFMWKTTTGVSDCCPFTYSNWSPGEPNCCPLISEKCLAVHSSPSYGMKWRDARCGAELCSVCQLDR